MRTLTTGLLTVLLAGASLSGIALGQEQGCINPAGHERGWCKHDRDDSRASANATISGTVVALNGSLATFRQDNGSTIIIDQGNLLRSGNRLAIGAHYVLRGFWQNNVFVVQNTGRYGNGGYGNGGYGNGGYGNGGYGNGGSGNGGYPNGQANATVRGVITAISGNRITIMQGLFSSVNINDSQALNNGSAQNLHLGQTVTAYGYWNNGTFYATSVG